MTVNSISSLGIRKRALAGVSLIALGVLVFRWAAGVWWTLLMVAWKEALLYPSYRHPDWLRVDIWGNFEYVVSILATETPGWLAIAGLLFVAGVVLLASAIGARYRQSDTAE